MARPKTFSPEQVLRLAMACFTAGGYEGTSIDDLVQALNLHRGSLYKEFGSKRGLFLAVLQEYVGSTLPTAIRAAVGGPDDAVEHLTTGSDLDLLLIAAVERGDTDSQVATLVRQALAQLDGVPETSPSPSHRKSRVGGRSATAILGARLDRRLLPATEGYEHSDTTQEEGI